MFTIETMNELGEWESQPTVPKTSEPFVCNPPDQFDPVAIRGIVDDHVTRGELITLDGSPSDEICLHLMLE